MGRDEPLWTDGNLHLHWYYGQIGTVDILEKTLLPFVKDASHLFVADNDTSTICFFARDFLLANNVNWCHTYSSQLSQSQSN